MATDIGKELFAQAVEERRPSINLVLDGGDNPKNFLPSPILSVSSNSKLNRRTIPEMAPQKSSS